MKRDRPLKKEFKIKKTYLLGGDRSARGEALRDSTGQGGGLPWNGSAETFAFLRSPRLKAEERHFLPACPVPPVRSRSSVFPPCGDESLGDSGLKGGLMSFLFWSYFK